MITVNEIVASPSRIGVDLLAVDKGAPLELDLVLQAISEGVLVTGSVSGETTGQCARCLSPMTDSVSIDLTELFAYPDSATEATAEEDEVGHIIDDMIDLEQSIIDEVVLQLPLSPVCSPDCRGLCPTCGVALATAEPGHHHDLIDPRWAKLAEMMPDSPEGTP